MKAPLLIQIEGDTHTARAFPNHAAFLQHVERQEARAKANGAKTWHAQAMRQARKTDVLVIYRGNQPAPVPTLRQVRAIVKAYREGAQ